MSNQRNRYRRGPKGGRKKSFNSPINLSTSDSNSSLHHSRTTN